MTHRNNAISRVVFLIRLVGFLTAGCSPPSANGQINRSSINNDNNEENNSQLTEFSIPTHTSAITRQPTKTNPPLHTEKYSKKLTTTLLPAVNTPISRVWDQKFVDNLKNTGNRSDRDSQNKFHLGYGERQPTMNILSSTIFRSTMDLSVSFNNDNRTATIGTFVPSDWAVI
jgi:hypothetical protein